MYLILEPQYSRDLHGERTNSNLYKSHFTTEIALVSQSIIQDPATIVFKLDSLTLLQDIVVTYEEIVSETAPEAV